MSKSNIIKNIQSNPHLLEFQKEEVISLIKEDEDFLDIKVLIGECLWRLVGIRLDDLKPMEHVTINTIKKEFENDNN